jgi:hypothetical protein
LGGVASIKARELVAQGVTSHRAIVVLAVDDYYIARLHLPIGKTGKSEIPITFSKKNRYTPYFWK